MHVHCSSTFMISVGRGTHVVKYSFKMYMALLRMGIAQYEAFPACAHRSLAVTRHSMSMVSRTYSQELEEVIHTVR